MWIEFPCVTFPAAKHPRQKNPWTGPSIWTTTPPRLCCPRCWKRCFPILRLRLATRPAAIATGRLARRALEDAREKIAGLLDADPEEVIFTSGATEANNLAIFGLAQSHLVVSPIEHPCVSEPVRRLGDLGEKSHAISYLPVDETGIVRWSEEVMRFDTGLVSVMLANHETGAVQPLAALVESLSGRALFHCDAAAGVGKMPVSFRRLGVTSLSVSAHKIHGPKGIGALLLRRGTRMKPLFWGGHQQHGHRPGTEAVALAVGFARALELAGGTWKATRPTSWDSAALPGPLQADAAPVVLNGPGAGGIPSTVNLSFPGCQADVCTWPSTWPASPVRPGRPVPAAPCCRPRCSGRWASKRAADLRDPFQPQSVVVTEKSSGL